LRHNRASVLGANQTRRNGDHWRGPPVERCGLKLKHYRSAFDTHDEGGGSCRRAVRPVNRNAEFVGWARHFDSGQARASRWLSRTTCRRTGPAPAGGAIFPGQRPVFGALSYSGREVPINCLSIEEAPRRNLLQRRTSRSSPVRDSRVYSCVVCTLVLYVRRVIARRRSSVKR
jgi:hypothetical protein